jgi:hypothetical protein
MAGVLHEGVGAEKAEEARLDLAGLQREAAGGEQREKEKE